MRNRWFFRERTGDHGGMQSIWKGAISFGLVSIPVRLFSATEEKDISFRQVHREDAGRIRYKRVCAVDGEEVPYSDIAKGYELPGGEMVVLDDDDFANLPISTSRAVDVLSFVPADQLDAVAYGKPYYCDPTGPDSKPYVLLRDSLEKSDRVAIVKVALRQRERLAMLRPRDGVLVLQTLLWPDEVRQAKFDFLDEDVSVRPQELAMAESYIDALSADFEPEEFSDGYRAALEEVIEAKVAGREIAAPQEQPADSGQVVDLMDALRRSVAEAKARRGEGSAALQEATSKKSGTGRSAAKTAKKAPTKKATAKSAPAKKSAAKKSAAKARTTSKSAAKKTATKAPAAKKSSKSTARKTA
ncbi:MAG: end-binding protein Ku [Actinomycetota bacterium]|jgi:DNA end-binding protein Ku|nr:end-binding protein Ku [Actinomycetota bacterium]